MPATAPDPFGFDNDDPLPVELALDHDPLDLESLIDQVEGWAQEGGSAVDALARELAQSMVAPPVAEGEEDDGVVRYRINDDTTAEYWARVLSNANAETSVLKARAKVYRDRIARWFDGGTRRAGARAAFAKALLDDYAMRQRVRFGDQRATIHLPSGKIGTRQPKTPTVDVIDDKAFMAWARENLTPDQWDECVKDQPEVKILGIRKLVTTERHDDGTYAVMVAGEKVPGLTAALGDVTPTVTVS